MGCIPRLTGRGLPRFDPDLSPSQVPGVVSAEGRTAAWILGHWRRGKAGAVEVERAVGADGVADGGSADRLAARWGPNPSVRQRRGPETQVRRGSTPALYPRSLNGSRGREQGPGTEDHRRPGDDLHDSNNGYSVCPWHPRWQPP
jgi:hypothetical protein